MARLNRAAQFAPFAALTGYDDLIRESERETDEQLDLDEDRILEKQNSLIDILYDENNASEEAKILKKEIDSENVRLARKWLQRGRSSDSADEN